MHKSGHEQGRNDQAMGHLSFSASVGCNSPNMCYIFNKFCNGFVSRMLSISLYTICSHYVFEMRTSYSILFSVLNPTKVRRVASVDVFNTWSSISCSYVSNFYFSLRLRSLSDHLKVFCSNPKYWWNSNLSTSYWV